MLNPYVTALYFIQTPHTIVSVTNFANKKLNIFFFKIEFKAQQTHTHKTQFT